LGSVLARGEAADPFVCLPGNMVEKGKVCYVPDPAGNATTGKHIIPAQPPIAHTPFRPTQPLPVCSMLQCLCCLPDAVDTGWMTCMFLGVRGWLRVSGTWCLYRGRHKVPWSAVVCRRRRTRASHVSESLNEGLRVPGPDSTGGPNGPLWSYNISPELELEARALVKNTVEFVDEYSSSS